MLTVKTILFPTDFSRCAQQALLYALTIARQYNAELHCFHATGPLDDSGGPVSHLPTVNDIQKMIRELATPDYQSLFPIEQLEQLKIHRAQNRDASIESAILNYATEHDIDLIVMGTHGRRGITHALLGSVAEAVVRSARVPVWTVREQKGPVSAGPIRRILVPLDLSEYGQAAVAYAKQLAAEYKAELQLLHVVEEIHDPAYYMVGQMSTFEFQPQLEVNAVRDMQLLLNRAGGPDVPSELFVKEGHPGQQVIDFAQTHHSDLIVISTHGLTGIEHLLWGSVTERVVQRASIPVLTVRPFGKSLIS
jgi:nucleotide-binding universal stress UspA family protein